MHPSSWKRRTCASLLPDVSLDVRLEIMCDLQSPALRKNHVINPLTQEWSHDFLQKWSVDKVMCATCEQKLEKPAHTVMSLSLASLTMFRHKFLPAWNKAATERWACGTWGVGGRAPSTSAEAVEGGRHPPLSTWTPVRPPLGTLPWTDCWSSHRPHRLTCRL